MLPVNSVILLEAMVCCIHFMCYTPVAMALHYPVPDISGDEVLFSIDFFVYIFVSLLARLRENGRTDLHEIFREGVE